MNRDEWVDSFAAAYLASLAASHLRNHGSPAIGRREVVQARDVAEAAADAWFAAKGERAGDATRYRVR